MRLAAAVLIAVAIVLLVVASVATSRPASEYQPFGAGETARALTGAPHGGYVVSLTDRPEHGAQPAENRRALDSAASAPKAGGAPLFRGLAGYAVPSLGSAYLAVRLPRGTLVTVTGPAGSWTTRTNDYGPSSRIRPPRVADVALGHWLTICGLPRSAGLCFVTITRGGPVPTAPATNVR